MIFAWWMACISDAYASTYYRRKPVLDDDDYDIDFYTVDPVNPDMVESNGPMPSPREQLEVRHDVPTTRHCSDQSHGILLVLGELRLPLMENLTNILSRVITAQHTP